MDISKFFFNDVSWLAISKVTFSSLHKFIRRLIKSFLLFSSSADVASSARIKYGLFIIALKIAIRCFCPTDKFLELFWYKIFFFIFNFSAKSKVLL